MSMTSGSKWVPKGWGGEKWIVNNDKYCGKLLYFMKGKSCSLHYHKLKDETFYIHKGQILLRYSHHLDGFLNPELNTIQVNPQLLCNTIYLRQGDSFHVPPNTVHQMTAVEDTELFEFSTHHEDEDSYRIIKGD